MLEAYLNLVPLRGEAQGIGAGANSLFGKRPAAMTRTDAALLAGLLPNPSAGAKTLGDRACRIAHATDCGDRNIVVYGTSVSFRLYLVGLLFITQTTTPFYTYHFFFFFF